VSGSGRREPALPMDSSTHGMIPEYRDGSQFRPNEDGFADDWDGDIRSGGRAAVG
jgi:hypothetical protein